MNVFILDTPVNITWLKSKMYVYVCLYVSLAVCIYRNSFASSLVFASREAIIRSCPMIASREA